MECMSASMSHSNDVHTEISRSGTIVKRAEDVNVTKNTSLMINSLWWFGLLLFKRDC